jgi:hypothetical protein
MTEAVPDPPTWCAGPHARAAWQNAYAAVTRRMEWDSGFNSMLGQMAAFAATYVEDVREGRPAATIEEKRVCLRGFLASFLVIDADMVDATGTIRADGLDRDIAELCDVPVLQ